MDDDRMSYLLEVEDGIYLICYDREGDSHYTFKETNQLYMATLFDFKISAFKANQVYIKEYPDKAELTLRITDRNAQFEICPNHKLDRW